MKTKKHFLFCPGPVNISQNVKDATQHEIGHREIEFSKLLLSINSKLLKLYEISHSKAYHSVLITGSGTAANESVLSSVVNGKNILIISNGEFGERLVEISKIYNPENTFHMKFEWAQHINVEAVRKFVKKNDIKVIAMVHHETSTGMLNPVNKIGLIAKDLNLTFIVDTVSSVGAEKINIEKWNITYCIGTSGKAISSLPGVAFVIAKKKDFEKLKEHTPRTMYLNLYKLYFYSAAHAQTPNTPAVQLFFALEQALENIIEEGVKERRKDLNRKAETLRAGMNKMGLKFHMDGDHMSSVLTTVKLPKYIDFTTLKSELKKKNIVVYNGKGSLTNKVFQVGNIGTFSEEDILYFLDSLKMLLKKYKYANAISFSTNESTITFTPTIESNNYLVNKSISLSQKENERTYKR